MLIPRRNLGTHAMFGGTYYTHALGEWQISWESVGLHRLWCHQTRRDAKHTVCVVMFNPGSLSGDGKDLTKDATLRFIRNAMPDTAAALILNLFTRATPDPSELIANWHERDCGAFDITVFRSKPIDALVYAYGDIGQAGTRNRLRKSEIRQRIGEIEEVLENITQLQLPEMLMTQKLGNPMHPKQWNIKQQIEVVRAGLTALLARRQSEEPVENRVRKW